MKSLYQNRDAQRAASNRSKDWLLKEKKINFGFRIFENIYIKILLYAIYEFYKLKEDLSDCFTGGGRRSTKRAEVQCNQRRL